MAEGIDRSSAVPLYHQLEMILRDDIEHGTYKVGDSLPSEGELCDRYDISRSVVRQTLSNLARSGLVRSERGRGTFVAETKLQERFVQRTRGFYEDLQTMGYPVSTRVLRQAIDLAPPYVRDFLGTDTCLRIDRLRAVDDRLLAYVTTYIDEGRVPGLVDMDLSDQSLYAVLEDHFGLRVGSGTRTVEAVNAVEDIATALDVEPGSSTLLLRSASYDEEGVPLEYFEAWHRGDRALFEVDIVSGNPDSDMHGRLRDEWPNVSSRLKASRSVSAPASNSLPAMGSNGRTVVEALESTRILAELRAEHYGNARALTSALAEGGIELVEFTMTGENALDAIAEAREVEGAVVGAGTVFDMPSARAAVEAGAQFLIAPTSALHITSADLGVPVLLAGFTPTEVWAAYNATGCPVKIFPMSVAGPEHLHSLRVVLPAVPMMPSGGVTPDNAIEYLRLGAVAVNIGSALCPPEALESGDTDTLYHNAVELRNVLAGAG